MTMTKRDRDRLMMAQMTEAFAKPDANGMSMRIVPHEPGPLFTLTLPLSLAPTMNVYAAKKRTPWAMAKLNKAVDMAIWHAKAAHGVDVLWFMPSMKVERSFLPAKGKARARIKETRTGGERRLVRLTRYSSREPDEVTVDACGGKLPVDRLVSAQVLRNDNREWCEREARWVKCAPKQGRVVIEVWGVLP